MRFGGEKYKKQYQWGIIWPLTASHTIERIWTQKQTPASVWLLTEWFISCFSSSLDALVADSEGEGCSEPPICYTVSSQSSLRTGLPSGDELDSFETNTEADCNISRTESLSLSSALHSKVFSSGFALLVVNAQNVFSLPPSLSPGQSLFSSRRRNTCVCVRRDSRDSCLLISMTPFWFLKSSSSWLMWLTYKKYMPFLHTWEMFPFHIFLLSFLTQKEENWWYWI